jgi:hypothetical protein
MDLTFLLMSLFLLPGCLGKVRNEDVLGWNPAIVVAYSAAESIS